MTVSTTSATEAGSIPDDWAEALRKQSYDPADAEALATRLCSSGVWPENRLVFRALWDTPLEQVRVVLLGQDPYSQPGKATGLAFSQDGQPTLGDSLDALFTNMDDDPDVSFSRPSSGAGDLALWADRGVLLLNSAFTVAENTPGSHRSTWRDFTRHLLQVLAVESRPIPFLLLGTSSPKWCPTRIPDPPHRVIPTTHPVAWSSKHIPLLRDATPFSDANRFLAAANQRGIDWRL